MRIVQVFYYPGKYTVDLWLAILGPFFFVTSESHVIYRENDESRQALYFVSSTT